MGNPAVWPSKFISYIHAEIAHVASCSRLRALVKSRCADLRMLHQD